MTLQCRNSFVDASKQHTVFSVPQSTNGIPFQYRRYPFFDMWSFKRGLKCRLVGRHGENDQGSDCWNFTFHLTSGELGSFACHALKNKNILKF